MKAMFRIMLWQKEVILAGVCSRVKRWSILWETLSDAIQKGPGTVSSSFTIWLSPLLMSASS
jgi:hypothetical protein